MKANYKKILVFISILLFIFIIILFSYVKYRNYIESTNPVVYVKDGLSINYLNGNHIHIKEKDSTYIFSVTNNTNETIKYCISLDKGNIKENTFYYDLTEEKGTINILKNELNQKSLKLVNMISIEPNETQSYTLTLYANENISLNMKLNINIEENHEEYFADILLNNNEIQTESSTKIGEEISSTYEGLIEANDDTGAYYYFRGKVENNYVSFANLLWRIVKINSDGSIKLVLNDYTETTANIYESNTEHSLEEKMNITANTLYENLNTWYQEHLKEYENHLISNKYCVDSSIFETKDNRNYYLGYNRILNDHTVSYNCLGTTYTSKIGLLSVDEVVLAGATSTLDNTEYYLYVPGKVVSWWTITPSTSDNENITFFEVDQNGKVVSVSNGNYFKGMRPTIYLIRKTIVSGTGTSTDPYTIK